MDNSQGSVHLGVGCCEQLHLLEIGYKYLYKHVLIFIMTKMAGSIKGGVKYRATYHNKNSFSVIKKTPLPDIITQFFHWSGAVNTHNKCHWAILRMEET